jgi:hypothetical protein
VTVVLGVVLYGLSAWLVARIVARRVTVRVQR